MLGEQEAVRSRARTEELRRRNCELAGSDGQDQRELREMIEIFQNQSLQVMELKALLVRYVMKVHCSVHPVELELDCSVKCVVCNVQCVVCSVSMLCVVSSV